ncbi:MAG TPA: hypothetical protein VI685_26190 [Candidatus Angelobacter sp.]
MNLLMTVFTATVLCGIQVMEAAELAPICLLRSQSAQSEQGPADSVAQSFVKLETTGARLTTEGWEKTEELFKNPTGKPFKLAVIVIASRYGFSKLHANSDQAQFYFGYEELGQLDEVLRFRQIRTSAEVRKFRQVNVVFVDKQQRVGTSGVSPRPAAPAEWKIDGSQPLETLVTPQAAIQYVTRMRDQTKDSAIKHNAAVPLSLLKRYLR